MRIALPLGAVLAIALTSPASAGWPQALSDGGLVVAGGFGSQHEPRVIPDGTGGTIVVWTWDVMANQTDLYAQRLAADGTEMWATGGVPVCTRPGLSLRADICADGEGGVFVIWQEADAVTPWDIYAQHLSPSGQRLWPANGIAISTAPSHQTEPKVVPDGAGGMYAVWVDQPGLNPPYDLYAQRVTANGTPLWSSGGIPVCDAAGDQRLFALAGDGAEGLFVAWADGRGLEFDIYGQHFGPLGTPQWTANGIVLCADAGEQADPFLVPDGAGGVFLGWYDLTGAGRGHRVRRTGPDGVARWQPPQRILTNYSAGLVRAGLAMDGTGGMIAAWYGGVFVNDVFAQRVDSTGSFLWGASGVLVCANPAIQGETVVTADGSGGVILAWSDLRGGTSDVYAQRLSAEGAPQWQPDGIPVVIASSDQMRARVVLEDRGGAIAYWQDSRTGAWDVHAQRIDRHGQLGDPAPRIDRVSDVLLDDGGQVEIEWIACRHDTMPEGPGTYQVQRRPPGPPEPDDWTVVAEIASDASPAYVLTVPTTSDSSAAGDALHAFRVLWTATPGGPSWVSLERTGRSVADGGSLDAPGGGGATLLHAAIPQPARREVRLRYELETAGHVRFTLVDATGRRVRTLAEGWRGRGPHELLLRRMEATGRAFPPGLYLAVLEAGGRLVSQRVLFLD